MTLRAPSPPLPQPAGPARWRCASSFSNHSPLQTWRPLRRSSGGLSLCFGFSTPANCRVSLQACGRAAPGSRACNFLAWTIKYHPPRRSRFSFSFPLKRRPAPICFPRTCSPFSTHTYMPNYWAPIHVGHLCHGAPPTHNAAILLGCRLRAT